MGINKNFKMRKNIFVRSFALLGCFLALCFILTPGNALARNIKVGVIDCYSGPPAIYCKDALNGFKMALGEINKECVLGKKIEFIKAAVRQGKYMKKHFIIFVNIFKSLECKSISY